MMVGLTSMSSERDEYVAVSRPRLTQCDLENRQGFVALGKSRIIFYFVNYWFR